MENSNAFPSLPICPHLGMKNDPGTSFRYPTLGNYCFSCKSAAVPHLEHQEAYCFSQAYQSCPAYAGASGRTLPLRLRARVQSHRRKPSLRFVILAMVIPLLAFVGWKTLRSEAAGLAEPSAYVIPVSGSETLTAVSTASPVPSQTPIPPTQTHSQPDPLQQAAFESQGHVLEIPFTAGEHSFLLHRVRPGESFAVLEVTYVTRSKVILALNDSLSAPLKANSVIVIAPGVQTVNPKLPSFRLHEVMEEMSIDELAQQLDVEPALLRYYNGCSNNCRMAPGDWLMIPDVQK